MSPASVSSQGTVPILDFLIIVEYVVVEEYPLQSHYKVLNDA